MSARNPITLKTAGDEAKQAGLLDEAMVLYNAAIALRPQYTAAHYEMGDIHFRRRQFLEAANSFALSWVNGRFFNQGALMLGRSYVGADLTLEACLVFERLNAADIDPASALFYADALRREGRIRDVIRVLPKIGEHPTDPSWRRIVGDAYLQLNELDKAEAILRPGIDDDDKCFIIDRLLGLYFAKRNYAEVDRILDMAMRREPNQDFYQGLRAMTDIIHRRPSSMKADPADGQYKMHDSAMYLKPFIEQGLPLTGTSYQTFDQIRPLVMDAGLILEFGVRNGHTIHHIADLFPNRKVFGFDSFEGLPEAWHNEAAGSYSAGGRIPRAPDNVEFVVGWFDQTLPGFKLKHKEPIALINVDCDLYSATKTIFDELNSQIVPGSVIVFDEYIINKTWREDEFKAFQEWVAAHKVTYEYVAASFFTKQTAVKIVSRD